mmetsp:Transcript_1458/g.3027  ORF Transcript_1458/g.3027 Transcript_1458/m.3027 type:complete len:593 (-) Transcript_1458:40-1818(-)
MLSMASRASLRYPIGVIKSTLTPSATRDSSTNTLLYTAVSRRRKLVIRSSRKPLRMPAVSESETLPSSFKTGFNSTTGFVARRVRTESHLAAFTSAGTSSKRVRARRTALTQSATIGSVLSAYATLLSGCTRPLTNPRPAPTDTNTRMPWLSTARRDRYGRSQSLRPLSQEQIVAVFNPDSRLNLPESDTKPSISSNQTPLPRCCSRIISSCNASSFARRTKCGLTSFGLGTTRFALVGAVARACDASEVSLHVELSFEARSIHVAHFAEHASLGPAHVVLAETPRDASKPIRPTTVELVPVIEFKSGGKRLFGRWHPLEDLLAPIHAHVPVDRAQTTQLALARVPILVLRSPVLELLSGVKRRSLVSAVVVQSDERKVWQRALIGVIVLVVEYKVSCKLAPHDKLFEERLGPCFHRGAARLLRCIHFGCDEERRDVPVMEIRAHVASRGTNCRVVAIVAKTSQFGRQKFVQPFQRFRLPTAYPADALHAAINIEPSQSTIHIAIIEQRHAKRIEQGRTFFGCPLPRNLSGELAVGLFETHKGALAVQKFGQALGHPWPEGSRRRLFFLTSSAHRNDHIGLDFYERTAEPRG